MNDLYALYRQSLKKDESNDRNHLSLAAAHMARGDDDDDRDDHRTGGRRERAGDGGAEDDSLRGFFAAVHA